LAKKTIQIALAMMITTEKSIYLTTELYTPKNQKEVTQNKGSHMSLKNCSKWI